MKNNSIKKLKLIIITLILSITIQGLTFLILPLKSLAASSTINTLLGDVTLKTDATRLKAGDIIPIEIYIGGDNIIQFSGYLNYNKDKFKKINVDTDIEKPRGWGVLEGSETEYGTEIFIYSMGNNYAYSKGLLATIYFTVLEDTDMEDFTIRFVNIVNSNFEDNMDEDYNLPDISLKVIGNNNTEEDLYLSSETYKIGDNDINNYEKGDKYISRVVKNTTKETFISNLKTNGTVKIIKQDGSELGENELVGTGMTIKITKEEEKIELKIAVMGDLSGEGQVTAQDLSTLNQRILEIVTLENEYKIAADLDENNNLTVTDLSEMNYMCLE